MIFPSKDNYLNPFTFLIIYLLDNFNFFPENKREILKIAFSKTCLDRKMFKMLYVPRNEGQFPR